MKTLLKSVFALLTLGLTVGVSKVQAYDLEACAKDPLVQKPQVINLLAPIDQKAINCIPNLDSLSNTWKSKAAQILSAVSGVKIGNDGNTRIDKLEYNTGANTIQFVASVQAKHTWKVDIPEIKENIPVTNYRWADIPYPDVRWVEKCQWKACIKVPEPFTNHRREKVPYVIMEMKVIRKASTVKESASTTCSYDYTLNLSTMEQKPVFACGQGSLGNYKLDASAITQILNGELPSIASLINSVSITPPLFVDANEDHYTKVRDEIITAHANSIVYFSSESFVKWASAENQGANIILAAVSGGSYGGEFLRQLQDKLTSELGFMTTFLSQTAVELGIEKLLSMITSKEKLTLNGYDISIEVVNTPYVIKKCVAQTNECTPPLPSPRLGFAIIATKI